MIKGVLQSIGIIQPERDHPRVHARELHLRAQTANPETRTVDAVVATENQALSFNLRTGQLILEVYLADGFVQPIKKQVPLLDTHQRGSTDHIRGSVRRLRVDSGAIVGTLHFGKTAKAEDDWANVRDGHLTDVSGGFRPMETVEIHAGKSSTVKGKRYTAPADRTLFIHTRWSLGEVSLACIGADVDAVVRRELHPGEDLIQHTQPKPEAASERVMGSQEAEVHKREAVFEEINRIQSLRDMDPNHDHEFIVQRLIDTPGAQPDDGAIEILRREQVIRAAQKE